MNSLLLKYLFLGFNMTELPQDYYKQNYIDIDQLDFSEVLSFEDDNFDSEVNYDFRCKFKVSNIKMYGEIISINKKDCFNIGIIKNF